MVRILQLRAARYSASTPSNRYAFAVGGLAAFAAIAVQSALDCTLHSPANAFTLAALMAGVLTCGVHGHKGTEDREDSRVGQLQYRRLGRLDRWIVVLPAGFLILLLGWAWMRTYPSAWFRHSANGYLARLQWSNAEHRLSSAWTCDPRSFETATAFGDLYAARATWNPEQRPALSARAIEWYGRALVINPYVHDNLIKMARLGDAIDQPDQARERYQQALQTDPLNASYHVEYGLFLQRRGDLTNALARFRRAWSLGGPDDRASLLLRDLGDPTVAVP